jgi:hypothetical protein
VLRDAVAAVCALIVLLVVALLVVRFRRDRGGARGVTADRPRTRGQHENRGPDRGSAAAAGHTTAANGAGAARWPRPPAAPGWASPAGWQGGGIGEIRPALDESSHPAVAPMPRSSPGYRAGRGAGRADGGPGPPWAPAPEPQRLIGPLPVASLGLHPLEPGRGIRLPGDMAAPPGAMTDPSPPVSFDLTTPPADFDLSTPAFGLTRPPSEAAPPAPEAPTTTPEAATTASEALTTASEAPPAEASPTPTRQSLGFAAAPVPADYAAPLADPGLETAVAADPSYIWDLAATDVFPAAEGAVPQDEAPEAGQG